MDETKQKLLARDVMVLPEEIDHAAYEYVLEGLLMHPEPVQLYCAGDGGDSGCAMSMVDLIQRHGQVIGMLAGDAASNHVTVWASCAQRFVFPRGRIGVHKVAWKSLNGRTDSLDLELWAAAFRASDLQNAAILASASKLPADEWFRTIQATGSGGVTEFNAAEMVAMGMARPVGEFVALTPQPPLPHGEGEKDRGNGQARGLFVQVDGRLMKTE